MNLLDKLIAAAEILKTDQEFSFSLLPGEPSGPEDIRLLELAINGALVHMHRKYSLTLLSGVLLLEYRKTDKK